MKNYRRYLYTFGQIAGLSLFLYQLWFASIELNSLNIKIDFLSVFMAIAISVLGMGVQMYAWKLIMLGLGYPLSLKFVVSGYTLSLLPRYIPGSIWGYLSRNEWLFHFQGISYGSSNISSVLEMSAVIFSALLIISTYFASITFIGKLAIVLAMIGLIFLVYLRLDVRSLNRKIERLLYLFKSYQINLTTFRLFFISTLFMFLSWICFGISLLLIIHSLKSLEVSFVNNIWGVTVVFATAWLIGFLIPFLPSGMGVREWAISYQLSYVFLIPTGYAIFASVANRVVLFFSELLWVLIGLYVRKRIDVSK